MGTWQCEAEHCGERGPYATREIAIREAVKHYE